MRRRNLLSKKNKFANEYLTFEVIENGSINFSGSTTANTLSYSLDGGTTWTTPRSSISFSTHSGDKILWKGSGMSPQFESGIGIFTTSSGKFNIEGNFMSLYYGDNFKGELNLSGKTAAFRCLFKGNTSLISLEKAILPAMTLPQDCYREMFSGCTSLTTVNKGLLPSDEIPVRGCYNMFQLCSSLRNMPDLPATTLGNYAYCGMFLSCTNLEDTTEVLPATTLSFQCYCWMFQGCQKIVTAPAILAPKLESESCRSMFPYCFSLNRITCLATDISAYNCTKNWVISVGGNGTFIKAPSMTSWTSGNDGIPNGWTVQDA